MGVKEVFFCGEGGCLDGLLFGDVLLSRYVIVRMYQEDSRTFSYPIPFPHPYPPSLSRSSRVLSHYPSRSRIVSPYRIRVPSPLYIHTPLHTPSFPTHLSTYLSHPPPAGPSKRYIPHDIRPQWLAYQRLAKCGYTSNPYLANQLGLALGLGLGAGGKYPCVQLGSRIAPINSRHT